MVELEDRTHPAAESRADEGDPLRWGLICWGPSRDEPHGGYCSFQSYAAAKSFAAHPDEWCPYCQER